MQAEKTHMQQKQEEYKGKKTET